MKFYLLHYMFTSYWTCVLLYNLQDNYIYLTNQWNIYKLQGYKDDIWKIWFQDTCISFKNTIYTYIILYFIPVYTNSNIFSYKDIYLFLLYILCIDLYFYMVHRLCHLNRWIYKHIHKHHHLTHLTVASSGFSSSLIEHIFINCASVYIPHLLLRGSYPLLVIIMILGGYSSASSHSGYKTSLYHNIHHQLLYYNYGNGLYIWDRIFGTFK